jgi:hypothetical protein
MASCSRATARRNAAETRCARARSLSSASPTSGKHPPEEVVRGRVTAPWSRPLGDLRRRPERPFRGDPRVARATTIHS